MADLFGQVSGQLTDKIFSGILWFGVTALVMTIVAFTMWFFLVYKKKFDIDVIIKSHRAEDRVSILFDKAAILYDREDGTPYFRIWNLKRDFPVPKFDVLQKSDKGDFLEIYRASEEEFYFLTPAIINNKKIIKSGGHMTAIADQEQIRVDPEMGFWIVKRKNANKKMFDTESFLMKIIPYIPQIIGGVITIFVLYILMDTLPQILTSLQRLAESMASSQRADIITG